MLFLLRKWSYWEAICFGRRDSSASACSRDAIFWTGRAHKWLMHGTGGSMQENAIKKYVRRMKKSSNASSEMASCFDCPQSIFQGRSGKVPSERKHCETL